MTIGNKNSRRYIKERITRAILSIGICLVFLFFVQPASGQTKLGEAIENTKKSAEDGFNFLIDWIVLSHSNYTGEMDAEVDNLFSILLEDLDQSPLLESILQEIATSGLELSTKAFFEQTGIRVYFVGQMTLDPDFEKFETIFEEFNRSLSAKLQYSSEPYIIVTSTLSGSKATGYEVVPTVTYSDVIREGKYNLNKQDATNPFYGIAQSGTSERKQMGRAIKDGLQAGINYLAANVEENYLPELLISYDGDLYRSDEQIRVSVASGEWAELTALTKEQQAPDDVVEWTVTPQDEVSQQAVIDGNKLTFPLDTKGTYRIEATAGRDEVALELAIIQIEINLNDILKELLIEILTPKLEANEEEQVQLQADSTSSMAEVDTNLRTLEGDNYPLTGSGGRPQALFDAPKQVEDSSYFNGSQQRRSGFTALRKRNKVVMDLNDLGKLKNYIEGVLNSAEELGNLSEELAAASGALLAKFTISALSGGDREEMKGIVRDYVDENLPQLAGLDEIMAILPLPVIERPQNVPDSYQGDMIHVSSQVPLEDRAALIEKIEAYQAQQEDPVFVVVNYSQDVSTESYLDRAATGAPVGLPDGANYVVVTYTNIPGSVNENVTYSTNTTINETAGDVGGMFEEEEEGTQQSDSFTNLIDQTISDCLDSNNPCVFVSPGGLPFTISAPIKSVKVFGEKDLDRYPLYNPNDYFLQAIYGFTLSGVQGNDQVYLADISGGYFRGYFLVGSNSRDFYKFPYTEGRIQSRYTIKHWNYENQEFNESTATSCAIFRPNQDWENYTAGGTAKPNDYNLSKLSDCDLFDDFYLKVEGLYSVDGQIHDFLERLNAIVEQYSECRAEGFQSYSEDGGEPEGIVPYCLWKDKQISIPYGSGDIAFSAGVIDGAYLEYEGLMDLVDLIEKLPEKVVETVVAYSYYYTVCEGIEVVKSHHLAAMDKAINENQEDVTYAWFKDYWNESKSDLLNYLDESTEDECNEKMKIIEPINDFFYAMTLAKTYEDIWKGIEDEFSETFGGIENVNRYKQGRLVVPIGSMFIGGAGVSTKLAKVQKVMDGLMGATNAVQRRFLKLFKNSDGLSNDVLRKLKQLDEAGEFPFEKLEVDLKDPDAGRFLKDLFNKNPDAVDAWRVLSDAGHDVSKNVDLLKRIDDGGFDLDKVGKFYEDMAHPSGFKGKVDYTATKTVNGKSVNVKYDKNGFPEFEDFSPGANTHIKSNNLTGNYELDNAIANEGLIKELGAESVWVNPAGNGSPVSIKVDGTWKNYTWHHYQDGKTMIPVEQAVHNTFSHSGGKQVIDSGLKGLFE
ncbi:MAG: hypothetical protein GY816_13855 [Cytophagales bacterium]|nr:hypothetical protein [Cytophagales bacterium]